MALLKMLNLALRFFLELCLLAALGYLGFRFGQVLLVKIMLAIILPLLAAIVWGRYLAPRARIVLPYWKWLSLQLILFAIAVVGLFITGKQQLAIIFGVAVALNIVLLAVWRQRDSVNEAGLSRQS